WRLLLKDVNEAFAEYRQSYPPRDPDMSRVVSNDELRQLTGDEGLRELTPPPCEDVVCGQPPYVPNTRLEEKYLWVVSPEAVQYALELLPGVIFQRGRLSHTNLTGGHPAHSGGEIWFIDPSSVVVNGGSGRYPPRSPDELDAAAQAFKKC